MKTTMKTLAIITVMAIAVSCRDKASEKRIAELESRLAQVEGNKSVTPAPTATPEAAAPVDEKPEGPLPTMEFSTTDHDFGTVEEGKKVSFTYKVKKFWTSSSHYPKCSPIMRLHSAGLDKGSHSGWRRRICKSRI